VTLAVGQRWDSGAPFPRVLTGLDGNGADAAIPLQFTDPALHPAIRAAHTTVSNPRGGTSALPVGLGNCGREGGVAESLAESFSPRSRWSWG
jgi:hypothetical protein